MASNVPSWSDLPKELLTTITNCLLQFPGDLSSFRSVCSSWRSSTPPFKISLPFPDVLIDNSGKSRHLNQISLYCIEPLINETPPASPTSWVIAVQFVGDKLYYLDPLTSLRTHPGSRPELPKELNLCNFSITELKKFYGTTELQKVVFVSTQHYDDTLLAVLPYSGNLVFYRLENSQWVMVKEMDDMGLLGIELYQGKVWGVTYDGRIIVFTSALDAIETTPCLFGDDGRTYSQFIESCGDLFVAEFGAFYGNAFPAVFTMFDEMIPMKIHKLVVEENRWVQVRHLEDRLFVLALDFPWSFSVPALMSPGGMKNCIVCSATPSVSSESDDGVSVCMTYSLWDIETDKHKIVPYAGRELFWHPPNWLIAGNPSE